MKTLFIDCSMGAAGDMITASLYELLSEEDREEFIKEINSIGIDGVKVSADESKKCGIKGTHFSVLVDGVEEDEHMHEHGHNHHHNHEHHHEHEHNHEQHDQHDHDHNHDHHHEHTHHHSGMADICSIIDGLKISDKVKEDAKNVYLLIAEAESYVHNSDISNIHFHEVGTMDAVADVVAVCMLMEKINPSSVISTAINTGSGMVRCAHGILPVPAPATAYILRDIPIYSGQIKSELCTPTGAALIKYFAKSFGEMPLMKVSKIGYGMGKKDFEAANCVRAMLGETESQKDKVIELSFNIDDMTSEELSFATEVLRDNGVLELFVTPVYMKKNRPGFLVTLLCNEDKKEEIIKIIFANMSTIGIREKEYNRYVLSRHIETIDTKYGPVRKKVSEGYGVHKEKYEYDDLANIAMNEKVSIADIKKELK